MKFNTYEFRVCFGEGRYAKGTYTVKAFTEAEATDLALTEICKKLYETLPELDIEVSVELIEKGEIVYDKYNIE